MRPTNCACGGTIFLSDEMIRQYQATFRANGQESRGSFLEEKELKAWQKPNLECQTLWISEMDWNELNLWINQFWSDLKWFFGDGCRRRITALVLANLSWASMNASAPVCDLIQSRHCDALLQKKNESFLGPRSPSRFWNWSINFPLASRIQRKQQLARPLLDLECETICRTENAESNPYLKLVSARTYHVDSFSEAASDVFDHICVFILSKLNSTLTVSKFQCLAEISRMPNCKTYAAVTMLKSQDVEENHLILAVPGACSHGDVAFRLIPLLIR